MRLSKMYILIIVTGVLAGVSSKPCANRELLLSLNKQLLRALEDQDGLPNPSVHLALRLSNRHNLAKESEHLNRLKTHLHNDIQSSLSGGQSVAGILALYTLALKASCYDLSTVSFTAGVRSEPLLTHLKRQMELEKEHVTTTRRPLSNWYQYSLGVLALCVSGVRVNNHVSNKLIKATEGGQLKHGEAESIDTLAMAGMALQCVKESASHVQSAAELDAVLATIKQKLLASQRADGHLGNAFSTGLAVQALLALGTQVEECAAYLEALRSDVRKETYHNAMAVSQTLPALQRTSYLHVKNMECRDEDDTLVLEPREPSVVSPIQASVAVGVEVEKSNGEVSAFSVDVPTGSSLLEGLELLQKKSVGFTFETQASLWGPFLSSVSGEQARQSDRRYWRTTSDGIALTQGIRDFKIEATQTIKITSTKY